MIPKDLKVNDTFTDEGREYRVTKVTDMGYESIATDCEIEETKLTESEWPIDADTAESEQEEVIELAETEIEPETTEEPKHICQYCGKECKNALGLASHEKACKENPINKEA